MSSQKTSRIIVLRILFSVYFSKRRVGVSIASHDEGEHEDVEEEEEHDYDDDDDEDDKR